VRGERIPGHGVRERGLGGDLAGWRRKLGHKATGVRLLARSRAFLRHVEVRPRDDLVALGSRGYGFWVVPGSVLGPESCCYLAGVGEDISFDLALIARFGCTVHAFDPVPAAQRYAAVAARHEPRLVFHPVGLWSSDTVLPLHAPAVDGHVSHSVTDLHGTVKVFDAQFRSVASLMRELGHDRLDLLKISAEGAEYEILREIIDDRLQAGVVCVEFAQPAPRGGAEEAFERMTSHGYDLVHAKITPWTWKVTFVQRTESEG
jgi:FkbM family methyltransferase